VYLRFVLVGGLSRRVRVSTVSVSQVHDVRGHRACVRVLRGAFPTGLESPRGQGMCGGAGVRVSFGSGFREGGFVMGFWGGSWFWGRWGKKPAPAIPEPPITECLHNAIGVMRDDHVVCLDCGLDMTTGKPREPPLQKVAH
jgi:hypothetical protein